MYKTPKYLKIEQYFVDKIESGILVNGYQLPSENELCNFFACSRMTVNKAMTSLSNNGYIKRIPGNGSFVDNAYLNSRGDILQQHSLSDEIRSFGLQPGSELLEYRIIKGKESPDIAQELEVGPDDFIHHFVRLRTGNEKPLVLSYSYIVYDLLPNFDIKCLETSFNAYLDSLGIKRSNGYTEFSAVMPDKQQADIIGSANHAILKQKIFWHFASLPFEITTHYYLVDSMSVIINRDYGASQNEFNTYKKMLKL